MITKEKNRTKIICAVVTAISAIVAGGSAFQLHMRNLFTNPSAPTVDCGVTQVDTVTDLCHLVAGFCGALDRHSHLVQPGLATEPARIGRQRTA